MSEWPMKPLGEVCKINPRLSKNHDISDEHEVSFVPMAAVDEFSGLISNRQARPFAEVKKGYTHFKDDDVLFAKITPCMENGKATIARDLAGGLGFGSTEFHVFRSLGEVLPEWIFYFVRRQQFRDTAKLNFTGTAGQQRVPTSFVETAQIPIPPLDEQRRIVDILSRAEGIVRLRREAQKKAAEIIPALFIDMFGDPATNPKGWATATVGDVIVSADYGSSTKASDYGLGIPMIRMGNVDYAGYTDLSNLKYIELLEEEVERYRLKNGDILFNRTNSKELVGKTGIWDYSYDAVAASYFIRVRVKRDILSPLYFWAFMNSRYMKRTLLDTARGAIGQSNINAKELKAFNIGVPSLNLQNYFEQRCRDLFGIKSQQSAATQKAESTFNALLSRAFQGELA